jgi:hypothetical protein
MRATPSGQNFDIAESHPMTFPEIVKAALELGVIPTIALFLVLAMYVQNRQLMKDRREMETQLLANLAQILSDYRELIVRLYTETDDK